MNEEQDEAIVKAAIAFIDQLNTYNDINNLEVTKRLVDLQKAVSVYWQKYNENETEPTIKTCFFCGADTVLTPVVKKVYKCVKCGAEGETLVKWKEKT